MRAAVMRSSQIVVDTVPDPEPQAGEVLVHNLVCGICGSDLHALQHGELMVEASREAGAPTVMDLSRDVIMGHEFCCEVLDYGAKANRTLKAGTRVVHPALLIRGAELHGIGYSNDVPGGFAERMVLSESMLVPASTRPDSWSINLPVSTALATTPVEWGRRSSAYVSSSSSPAMPRSTSVSFQIKLAASRIPEHSPCPKNGGI